MVQLTLPKGSAPKKGKEWPKPEGAKNTKAFKIYRYSPEEGGNPTWDTYHVDMDRCGPMVLDVLIWIKNNIDPKTTHRIWKSMIWSYVDFQKRNFKKK